MNGRRAAFQALRSVTGGAYSNLALKDSLRDCDEGDVKFASALLYNTLDHLLTIDYIIGAKAKSVKPAVKDILRLGVCQLLYMDVPESAACNESVKLAKSVGKGGVAGFINAVLRKIAGEGKALLDIEDLALRESWPEWIAQMWTADYGKERCEALLLYRKPPRLCVRFNPFVKCDETLEYERGKLCREALYIKNAGDISKKPLFTSGAIAVQSESSMLVCKAVDPKRGNTLLDACSAPGGKAMCMAALMGDGQIDAWDIHPHRAELVKKNAERLHIGCINANVKDASEYAEALEAHYDAVLVDAPCSGLGDYAGKPDVKYSKTPEDILQLAALQSRLLETCSRYVKKGGALVYSTCTISKRENQDVVTAFLDGHADFRIDDISPALPEDFDKDRLRDGWLQLFPDIDGVEGFFICRMTRS